MRIEYGNDDWRARARPFLCFWGWFRKVKKIKVSKAKGIFIVLYIPQIENDI